MAFVSVDNIVNKFNDFNKSSNFSGSLSNSRRLFEQNLVSQTSKFGNSLNQEVSGYISLTNSLDDLVPVIDYSIPDQSTGNLDVVQLTDRLSAVKNKLVISLGPLQADIDLITGGSSTSSLLNVNITSGIPQAIGQSLSSLGISNSEVLNIVTGLQNTENDLFEKIEVSAENLLGSILGPVISISNSLDNLKNQVFDEISTLAGGILDEVDAGFSSVIENVTENITGNGSQTIRNIITRNNGILPSANEISLALNYYALGNKEAAVNVIKQSIPDVRVDVILTELNTIDLRVSSNQQNISTPGISNNFIDLNGYGNNWDGSNTLIKNAASTSSIGHGFTNVYTHEELEIELKSIKREVTEIITHWTETHTNQDIGAEEIQRSSGDIPYHYLIRRDGSLQRGRPVNLVGGSLANGHERYSIQIAFVGGINSPTGIENVDPFLSADSLTRKQMTTYQDFLKIAYSAWPGIQVMGHNDIDNTQQDPGFDVVNFTELNFGKTIILTDPSVRGPYSRTELIKTRIPYL